MKRILFLLLIIPALARSQYPVNTPQGTPGQLQYQQGSYGAMKGFVYKGTFADTATANLSFIANVPGQTIRVVDTIFMRSNDATKWINLTAGAYYTKTQINAFFSGLTPIAGYNKTNWDNVYAAYANSLTHGGWAYQNALVDSAAALRAAIGIGSGGSGDMSKAIYDANNNGIVDAVEAFTEADPNVPTLVKNIPVSADAATNKYLNWNGSAYVRKQVDYSEISGTPSITETDPLSIHNQVAVNQTGAGWVDSMKLQRALVVGTRPSDTTVQAVVLNVPNRRNLLVGDAPPNFDDVSEKYTDSSSYNYIGVRDTISETNTDSYNMVNKHPKATLGIERWQVIGQDNIDVEQTGALDVRKTIDMSSKDSVNFVPSGSDYVWATRNQLLVYNHTPSHKAILKSTPTDWDVSTVNLNTLNMSTTGSLGSHLKGYWSGTTSYTVGKVALDTIDNYIGFLSTGAGLGPYIGNRYDFASSQGSTNRFGKYWFLYQNPISGTDSSYSFINGKLAIGGGSTKTMPTRRLEVNGPAWVDNLITDSINVDNGTLTFSGGKIRHHIGVPRFGTTGNSMSLWYVDTAANSGVTSFNKILEMNRYSQMLDGQHLSIAPYAWLVRSFLNVDNNTTMANDYQQAVVGSIIGAGFDTKTGITSSTVTAGTTPTLSMGVSIQKFVNQGSGTRNITGFVSNGKFAIDAPTAGTIDNYSDITTGIIGNAGLATTITNKYGMYITPISGATITHPYSIYSEGTGDTAYFAGHMKLGTMPSLSDSSNRVPTTEWVKRQGFGSGSGVGGGTTTNPLTFSNGGAGAASGATFDGSAARTISYNSIGAAHTVRVNSTTYTADASGLVDLGTLAAGGWNGGTSGTAYSATNATIDATALIWTFTGSSPATFTLPSYATFGNRVVIIKNIGSANLTISRAGTDQIYTSSTVTSFTLVAGTSVAITAAANGLTNTWETLFDPSSGGGMTNPMTTANDIIVGGSSGTPTRLPAGGEGTSLTVSGGNVTWLSGTSWNGAYASSASGSLAGNTFGNTNTTLQIHTGGSGTVTLPLVSGAYTKGLHFINQGTGTLTIARQSSDQIFYHGANVTSFPLAVGQSCAVFLINSLWTVFFDGYDPSNVTASSTTVFSNKDFTGSGNTFPTFNQNTTGSAASLTTTRTLWGQNFNGTANVSGDLGTTGTRVTKVWATDGEFTNMITIGGTNLSSTAAVLSNKSIDFGSNTITMTRAQLNAAISDGDVVTYAESSITSNATWSPAGDLRENYYDITAQAAAVTTVNAPSGTPANHNTLLIRVTSDASNRAISGWNAIYRVGTNLILPTTTTASKTMYIKFIYNSTASKWDLISVLDGL